MRTYAEGTAWKFFIPKNRIRYLLTPKGVAEKTRLTYEYIQYSYTFYKEARQKLRNLYSDLEEQGVTFIVFYGASGLAEIAYISLQETNIELIAVVDDEKIGKRFMRWVVEHPDRLVSFYFDKIIITTLNSSEQIMEKLSSIGISKESVVQIN